MSKKAPEFPVWAALEYLGVADVPHVSGKKTFEKMLCPFHPDTKPSAHVSEIGFQCFACEASGDAIKLMRERGGLDYKTAIRILQERTGITDRASEPGRQWGESLLG